MLHQNILFTITTTKLSKQTIILTLGKLLDKKKLNNHCIELIFTEVFVLQKNLI